MIELPIKERILIYLSDHPEMQSKDSIFSQKGIAEGIGASIKTVSKRLENLKEEGLVEAKKTFFIETGRFRKFYFLTLRGIKEAKELRDELGRKEIRVREKDRVKQMKISELIEHLENPEINYTEVIQNVRGDYLDVRLLLKPRRWVDYSEKRAEIKHFFGRQAELKEMGDFINSTSKFLCIKGVAGIGKTTLLSKFLEGLEMDIFWYRFSEFTTIRSLLNRLSGFLLKMERRRLQNYLEGERFEVEEILILLEEELKGINALLVLDDFYKASREIVNFSRSFKGLELNVKIITAGREIPLFYDRKDVVMKKNIREMTLRGLDKESGLELLKHRKIEKDLERLYSLTKGHPLLLELITPETEAEAEEYIKEEIIGKLTSEEKKVLEFASVFRCPFPSRAVNAPYDLLDELVDRSLMQRSGETYDLYDVIREFMFGMLSEGYDLYDVIREFMFGMLSEGKKMDYHQRIANYYENEKSESAIIEAMYHYLQAHKCEKTFELTVENGNKLISKGYDRELLMILQEFEKDQVGKERWAKIELLKADIAFRDGEWDEALEECTQILSSVDKEVLAKAYQKIAAIYELKGNVEKGEKMLDQSLKLCKECGNSKMMAENYHRRGVMYWTIGEPENALDYLNRSLEIAKSIGDKPLIAGILTSISMVYNLKGEHEKELGVLRKALEFLEGLDDK